MAEGKDAHRTMGLAVVPLQSPREFLRSRDGIRRDRPSNDHICYRRAIPHVPKVTTRSRIKSAPPTINFKTMNIQSVMQATPRRPQPRYVDTRNGDFHDLQKSGLKPLFIYRPKFGAVPNYIKQRVQQIRDLEERQRQHEIRKQKMCRYVTQTERNEVLDGLRHNWDELQHKYQGLSIITDTLTKRMRKLNIESQLKKLEKDILLVESNPNIYIYEEKANDDDESHKSQK